jgi:glycosyltransferase involved in cell wall biosynthesis
MMAGNHKAKRFGAQNPVRVLFVSHESGLTGAERSLLEAVRGIDRKRYEPVVAVPGNGPLIEELKLAGIGVVISRMRWWVARGRKKRSELKETILGMPERAAQIRGLIRAHRIDLVYSNSVACIDGALAAKLARVPHVWHIHEILSKNIELRPYVPMWMVRVIVACLSHRIIVPSKAVQRDIAGRLSAGKVRVRYNGVDLARFQRGTHSTGQNDIRAELGTGSNVIIAAVVGLFMPIKGHLDVVEAARTVCDVRKDVLFLFVGGGSKGYRKRVEQRISELNLTKHFIFLSFRNDIETLMMSIDVLICASWVESFSRVVLEAMAAGKPVVATRCGGPEELVVDGQTGILVPTHCPERIATAVLKLVEDARLMLWMGQNGHERAAGLFSMTQYLRGIEAVLDEICRR